MILETSIFNLKLYVDAGYASKATDGRSVPGAAVLCRGIPITWLSRTQKCATLSMAEAENVVKGDGVKQPILWG